VRNNIIASNIAAFEKGAATILFFKSTLDSFMLVATTKEQLSFAFGAQYVQTDAKNDLCDDQAPVSVIVCKTASSPFWEPVSILLSSSETSASIHTLFKVTQHAMPCSEACDHPLEFVLNGEGSFISYRKCRGPPESNLAGCELSSVPPSRVDLEGGLSSSSSSSSSLVLATAEMPAAPPSWDPLVGIDQCSTAKLGVQSCGLELSICAFHVYKSFRLHLTSELRLSQSQAAIFDAAAHILLRARTLEKHGAVLSVFSDQIKVWASSGLLNGISTVELDAYVKLHLGGHGQWDGKIGDHRGCDADGTFSVRDWSTSNCGVESFWAMTDRFLLGGYKNKKASTVALQFMLGVNERAVSSAGKSFWSVASERRLESAPRSERTEERLPRMNGAWLSQLTAAEADSLGAQGGGAPVQQGTGGNGGYTFVRLGIPNIALPTEKEASSNQSFNSTLLAEASMSLVPLCEALFGGVPKVLGFATTTGELCNRCPSHLHFGCSRGEMCKHVAARNASLGKMTATGGKTAVEYLSDKLRNREQNKPAQLKDKKLWSSEWKVQRGGLMAGSKSRTVSSRAPMSSPRTSTASTSTAGAPAPSEGRVVLNAGAVLDDHAYFSHGDNSSVVLALKSSPTSMERGIGFQLRAGDSVSSRSRGRGASGVASLSLSSSSSTAALHVARAGGNGPRAAAAATATAAAAAAGSATTTAAVARSQHHNKAAEQRHGGGLARGARKPGGGREYLRVATVAEISDGARPGDLKSKNKKSGGPKQIGAKSSSKKRPRSAAISKAVSVALGSPMKKQRSDHTPTKKKR
jgi:hypothetical protein